MSWSLSLLPLHLISSPAHSSHPGLLLSLTPSSIPFHGLLNLVFPPLGMALVQISAWETLLINSGLITDVTCQEECSNKFNPTPITLHCCIFWYHLSLFTNISFIDSFPFTLSCFCAQGCNNDSYYLCSSCYMLCMTLSALVYIYMKSLQEPVRKELFSPVLKLKRLRHREFKECAWCLTACEWTCEDLNPGSQLQSQFP